MNYALATTCLAALLACRSGPPAGDERGAPVVKLHGDVAHPGAIANAEGLWTVPRLPLPWTARGGCVRTIDVGFISVGIS